MADYPHAPAQAFIQAPAEPQPTAPAVSSALKRVSVPSNGFTFELPHGWVADFASEPKRSPGAANYIDPKGTMRFQISEFALGVPLSADELAAQMIKSQYKVYPACTVLQRKEIPPGPAENASGSRLRP